MSSLVVKILFASHLVRFTLSAPQQPEINDQFETNFTEIDTPKESANFVNRTTSAETVKFDVVVKDTKRDKRKYLEKANVVENVNIKVGTKPNFITTLFEMLTRPIEKFIALPKVTFVLKNVGTCLVNGAMEIISYYLPAPFIPLIATAAGMVIPFEPVVMLKEKMPVTSYRRAFRKAMSSFLNTFDGYKFNNYEDDPYMTRRFNRRFMNDVSEERKENKNDIH